MNQRDSPELIQQSRSDQTPFAEQICYSPISKGAVTSAGLGVFCMLGFIFFWLTSDHFQGPFSAGGGC
ncbi:MAG TPA: hypothetical protein DCY03_30120 [Planctomycetaceae bacterium]|nr:hypothetical protein [Planctomycetaceae bacterium]